MIDNLIATLQCMLFVRDLMGDVLFVSKIYWFNW